MDAYSVKRAAYFGLFVLSVSRHKEMARLKIQSVFLASSSDETRAGNHHIGVKETVSFLQRMAKTQCKQWKQSFAVDTERENRII